MVRSIHINDKGSTLGGLPAGRELRTPEALALAEWYLICHDLTSSLRNIVLLQDRYKFVTESAEEHALAEALYRDAVIQFVECFGNKPNHLSKIDVLGGVDGGLESLQYLEDLRNSYVAHRFGPARQCFIVIVEDENGIGVKQLCLTFSLPIPATLPAYVDIIKLALTAAEERVLELAAVVEAQVRAMTPEHISKLPELTVRTPGANELVMSRGRFRSGKPGRSGQSRQTL